MKYISFDTWWGGFNNIRQSFELAAGISYMTGRTLILPKKIFVDHINYHTDKKTFFDIWDIYDKQLFKQEFNCIDYSEIKLYQKYNTKQQYFDSICNDIKCISENPKNWGPNDSLLDCIITNTDVKTNKKIIDLRIEDQYIHFPRNLFGHFYDILNIDNDFKYKLRKGLRIKDSIEKLAKKILPNNYNAVHIRLKDFIDFREKETKYIKENLYDLIKLNFDNNKPLFIATDDKKFDGFNEIKNKYDVIFLDNYDKINSIFLDMVICSNADKFIGTEYSTFTDYIHILRHYKGNKDYSKEGLNYNYKKIKNKKENYNWHTLFVENY